MMGGKPEIIQPFLDRIQTKLDIYQDDKDDPETCLDSYAYLTFMKAVCMRHLGFPLQAIDMFQDVLSCKKRIEFEKHLLPQACFELGAINRKLGHLTEAKKWLKKSRDDYSNYLTEIMIQYRCNHLLKLIKREQDGEV